MDVKENETQPLVLRKLQLNKKTDMYSDMYNTKYGIEALVEIWGSETC